MEQVLADRQEGASAAADKVPGMYAVVDASGSAPTTVISMPATGGNEWHTPAVG